MRYIVETIKEGSWNKIHRLERNGEIRIVEKSDPLEVVKTKLRKIARSLQILKKSGIDKYVMRQFLKAETNLPYKDIDEILFQQEEFFEKIGIELV